VFLGFYWGLGFFVGGGVKLVIVKRSNLMHFAISTGFQLSE